MLKNKLDDHWNDVGVKKATYQVTYQVQTSSERFGQPLDVGRGMADGVQRVKMQSHALGS